MRSTGYCGPVSAHLFVIQDDLMFAQRALSAGRRLGATVQTVSHDDARTRVWHADDVVVVQATLRPEQQLALIDQVLQQNPQPIVVAVTGHLETDLRRRLKAKGVRLAAHSAMDRVLARALDLSADRDAADDVDDPHVTPHPSA